MGKLCALNLEIGDIVKSRAGHDQGRVYMVTAVLNEDFVLVADGQYRKIDNPKQKRKKHLKFEGKANAAFTDEEIAVKIKKTEDSNAKRR